MYLMQYLTHACNAYLSFHRNNSKDLLQPLDPEGKLFTPSTSKKPLYRRDIGKRCGDYNALLRPFLSFFSQ